MVLQNFAHLKELIAGQKIKTKVAAVCPDDEATLLALKEAINLGICHVLAVGNEDLITKLWQKIEGPNEGFEIINAPQPEEAAQKAVKEAAEGRAQSIMKGNLDTAVLLRTVVKADSGLRHSDLMSHLAFFEIPGQKKLIALTDSGMVLSPDYEDKKKILANALKVFQSFGYTKIKIGVLAAVEKVNPKMKDTVEAARLQEENQQGFLPQAIIEGPLSYDILMSQEIAEKKKFYSQVSGDCDLMLIDNMSAGNILGKSLIISAGAKMAGLVVGAKVPIALNSRGATQEEKLNGLMLASYFS